MKLTLYESNGMFAAEFSNVTNVEFDSAKDEFTVTQNHMRVQTGSMMGGRAVISLDDVEFDDGK